MLRTIIFQPDIPVSVLLALAAVSVVVVALALIRRLPGWWLRALAAATLLLALANPSLKEEDRDPLADIALVVIDETASQGIDIRPGQLARAAARLADELGRDPAELIVETLRVGDAAGGDSDRGTMLATALAKAGAEHDAERLAGAIIVSDGRVDDAEILPDFPAPVHLLLTGREDEWDRRIKLITAPSFGIIGEPVSVTLRIEEQGAIPAGSPPVLPLMLSIDGGTPRGVQLPVNQDVTVTLDLAHGGLNVVQLTVPTGSGELTDRNNSAVISINGVRDRLRVLLVSGEPHAGERTWRNLLKSDPAVDLVHFTILRPPHKNDGVPVYELSLIAFPTRELFMDKIDEFDLIIFDRYRRRGVLPTLYMENIVRYVEDGGALLVASGPSFAGAESLYRTPLADILPVAPTTEVIETPYVPMIAALGQRHPVTFGLEQFAPRDMVDGVPGWGRWMRLVDTIPVSGQVVMEGVDQRPLLTMDRPGTGRIAALSSDQAWLWSRGFEGGGPQLELLRRLAHWLMKEPELEEEVLAATATGGTVVITRRSMADRAADVVVTAPDGQETIVPLTESAPGQFQGQFKGTENGLYRLGDGVKTAVVAVGPAAPKEFENPLSTTAILAPLISASAGGALRLADGFPDIRRVREGRVAAGRGWIGLERRNAYTVSDIRLTPLAPGWMLLLLAAGFAIAAWRVEGR